MTFSSATALPPAPAYPLSALVGQDALVEALLVCAVDPAIGGVLVRGERGTAKTTAVRALAPMLGDGARLTELPLGATLDRLVGSLDVGAAIGGEYRVQSGLLADADGGVLYVDEVNLLGDHLVDVLLDAAASGRVNVERDGISMAQPSRFLLVGTMNPEEGELRPQLLDRFGLSAQVHGSRDPHVRAEIVRRRLAFDADPAAFCAAWAEREQATAQRLSEAQQRLAGVELSTRMLEQITRTCAQLELDGIRGDLVCARAARALAALDGGDEVDAQHVARAAHLALRHRMRRDPLAPPPPPGASDPAIDDALERADADADDAGGAAQQPSDAAPSSGAVPDDGAGASKARANAPAPRGRGENGSGPASAAPAARPTATPARIPGDALSLVAVGGARARSRGRDVVDVPAGRRRGGTLAVVDARPACAHEPVAALPTLLAALRGAPAVMTPIHGGGRSAHLVLVVDTSGSMAARRRLARVKGALEAVLRDAYARRDRVTVVAFAGTGAQTVVRAGTPIEQAAAAIAELPAGGRTPLAEGVEYAAQLLLGRWRGPVAGAPGTGSMPAPLPDDGRARVLLLLTDGRAADPGGRAAAALTAITHAVDRAVVVDLEDGPVRLGLAAQLAARAGADLTRLIDPTQRAA